MSTHEPKTLFEARTLIKNLRAQLAGHGPPAGSRPIPKLPERPPTADPSIPPPEPSPPGTPAGMNLSDMSPKAFAEMVDRSNNKTLFALLSRETAKSGKQQDASVVDRLYKELKKRGA
jgi:hypothetical protein